MPLYLHIQRDFKLASAGTATLLVTIMMASYFLPRYPMGVLADRVNRKKLLTIGLILNVCQGYGARWTFCRFDVVMRRL